MNGGHQLAPSGTITDIFYILYYMLTDIIIIIIFYIV